MELPKEIIEKLNLDEVAVKELNTTFSDAIADVKKEYDGKANKDAEAILNGASDKIKEVFGIERQQGEKITPYILRVNESKLESLKSDYLKSKKEYEDKISNFKGDDDSKQALEKYKVDYDKLLQKYADYDALREKATKYDPLESEYNTMKRETAFAISKPNFPPEANKYEVDAKFKEVKDRISEAYNIELINGEAFAIDKENIHKRAKLSDLINKDENIISLLKGRRQTGANSNVATKEIKGVPFKVPEGINSAERSTMIREYIISQGISFQSDEYSALFASINKAYLNG